MAAGGDGGDGAPTLRNDKQQTGSGMLSLPNTAIHVQTVLTGKTQTVLSCVGPPTLEKDTKRKTFSLPGHIDAPVFAGPGVSLEKKPELQVYGVLFPLTFPECLFVNFYILWS